MLLHCKSILALVISLAALFGSPCSAPAADQAGAEKVKLPVKVAVVDAVKWNGEPVGNIQVTYADGTKDRWTTKGGCGLARVAVDGTVGWNIFEDERPARTASYNIRPNGTMVMCRKGKVLCRVQTALGFVEEWHFTKDGRCFVVKSRALHGPATIELRETDTGKVVQTVRASDAHVPAWAAPYRE